MNANVPISSMPSVLVEIQALTLARGERVLIDNLSLSLPSNSLLYVTGENGIGKTSLLLALAGLLPPKSGAVDYTVDGVNGARPFDVAALLSQPDGASHGLTTAEDLNFHLKLVKAKLSCDTWLSKVGMTEAASVPIGGLSLGQRKRLSLAKIMASNRPLWLLDEPFSALDAHGRAFVAETLRNHVASGGIAVVATHNPAMIDGISVKTLHLRTGVS